MAACPPFLSTYHLTDCYSRNTANQISETVQGAGATASKEGNKGTTTLQCHSLLAPNPLTSPYRDRKGPHQCFRNHPLGCHQGCSARQDEREEARSTALTLCVNLIADTDIVHRPSRMSTLTSRYALCYQGIHPLI